MVMGFLQICSGVVLLQLSKSSKNVPDTEILRGDLDQIRTVAEQSEPESEPKADTIRGTAAIIRRMSVARRTAEADEARKIHEERQRDLHTPLPAGETVEWDGVKRRVTWTGEYGGTGRRNTLSGQHPPLGMARIPDEEEAREEQPAGRRRSMSFDEAMRQRVYGQQPDEEGPRPESFLGRFRGLLNPKRSKASLKEPTDPATIVPHRDLRDVSCSSPVLRMPGARPRVHSDTTMPSNLPSSATSQSSPNVNHITFAGGSPEMKTCDFAATPLSVPGYQRTISRDGSEYQFVPSGSLAVPEPPATPAGGGKSKDTLRPDSRHSTRRQFSFQFLHRHSHGRSESQGSMESDGGGRHSLGWKQKLPVGGSKTEEERLGLVKGDSVSTRQETLRSDSPSSVDKGGGVRAVPREDEIPGTEWNEKGFGGGTDLMR